MSVWVLDQDAAKEFYEKKLGFTVTTDFTMENGMRWLTVRPPGSETQELVLMDPLHSMLDEETAQQVRALVAELTARRDAAATALAFEFAAKLQAELEAVDWITAEQKVTRGPRDLRDADVYGWAGGVLVCFEIRGGRMSGWRQRPCPAAAARRYLEQSPPGWTAFTHRSAELAARLRPSPRRTCAG